MTTATIDAPEAEAALRTEKVTFMARSENQVLTRKRTRKVADPITSDWKVETEDEWRATQEAANDRLIREGKEPIDFDRSPWKVQFVLNRYETDDPVIIDWLRRHPKFGYNGPSGFYEVVDPVDVADLEPTVDDQLRALQEALLTHQLEGAEAVLRTEQETHNRPQVLKAAESAVESLRELAAAVAGGAPNGEPPSTSNA